MVRLVDPRVNTFASEASAHQGAKPFRVCWNKSKEKILTLGHSKTSERQLFYWDPRSMSHPISMLTIDNGSGSLMNLFDEDNSVLYVGGRGDSNIRFYELVDSDPYLHYLNEYKSSNAQRGIAWSPKTDCEALSCEVARAYKLDSNHCITRISFIVPRKTTEFQCDLFPDTASQESIITSEQYFAGENAGPRLVGWQK